MKDPRVTKLAYNLVNNSVKVQKGDNVLIENTGFEKALVTCLIEEIYRAGGQPFVRLHDAAVNRALLMGLTDQQAALIAQNEAALMEKMQGYIGLRSGENAYEMADVPSEKDALYARGVWEKVHGQIRVPKTRWVVLRYPAPSMAQKARMSTEAFEDYYFDVCCLDYGKMDRAMNPLVEWMNRTDRVRITGPGTDLSFSIKGIPAIKCAGDMNIPDGEVYTAPVKNSVNGVITYNAPSVYSGFTFENVRLTFAGGKIVEATANDSARINRVFDTDPGARYVGEFALGVNPYVTSPMMDTLFDEKISGSFHFTPGACYDECPNGNKSAVHWDLVNIQTPEWGGGEIWFDDALVRKDGLFVPEALTCLNPEHLK